MILTIFTISPKFLPESGFITSEQDPFPFLWQPVRDVTYIHVYAVLLGTFSFLDFVQITSPPPPLPIWTACTIYILVQCLPVVSKRSLWQEFLWKNCPLQGLESSALDKSKCSHLSSEKKKLHHSARSTFTASLFCWLWPLSSREAQSFPYQQGLQDVPCGKR